MLCIFTFIFKLYCPLQCEYVVVLCFQGGLGITGHDPEHSACDRSPGAWAASPAVVSKEQAGALRLKETFHHSCACIKPDSELDAAGRSAAWAPIWP